MLFEFLEVRSGNTELENGITNGNAFNEENPAGPTTERSDGNNEQADEAGGNTNEGVESAETTTQTPESTTAEETTAAPSTTVDEESETETVVSEVTTEPADGKTGGFHMDGRTITAVIIFLLVAAAVCALIAIILKKRSDRKAPKQPMQPMQPPMAPPAYPPAMPYIGDEELDRTVAPYPTAPESDRTTPLFNEPSAGEAKAPAFANKVNVISVHNIGNRAKQEDSLGFSDVNNAHLTQSKGVLGVVADGMGGLVGGEDVSSKLVVDMLQSFSERPPFTNASDELEQLMQHAVEEVNTFLKQTVGLKNSGSTLMAVILKDHQLSWVSVGDSRIVLLRKGMLTTLNQRHIYGAELDEMVRQGKLSAAEAQSNPHRGELTSYVGMGELKYVDRSIRSIDLKPGDKVMLMSDGIFNSLSDQEIVSILQLPSDSISTELENAVLAKQKKYQDNFTALIFEI